MGSPRQDAMWVNFVTDLSGRLVGRLPYERMDRGVLDVTPTVGVHLLSLSFFSLRVLGNLKGDWLMDCLLDDS